MAKTYPALTAMNLCRAPGRGFSRSQACRCAVSIRNGRVSAPRSLSGRILRWQCVRLLWNAAPIESSSGHGWLSERSALPDGCVGSLTVSLKAFRWQPDSARTAGCSPSR